jgi:light-regulated signal transduction histidine kinase (bacteriophytochrome)
LQASDKLEEKLQIVSHDRCAQEPVQIIGRIQSHGLLFALSEPDLMVRQASSNVAALLGGSADGFLGRSFETVLGTRQFEAFRSQALLGASFSTTLVRLPAGSGTLEMNCLAHRQDGVLIVEFELIEGAHSIAPLDIDAHIRIPLSRMETASDALELSRMAADEIRKVSGFHRVMVYRFDDEWNGEVVAEAASPSPVSYLGLRFPSGDIPPQVRRLFLINPLRAIADADSMPSPLVPEIEPLTGRPLDLSKSVLRSASPIHLEYLRNMGVGSSLTVSIVVEQRLWGMIACHDPAPRRLDHETRSVCELIGQILASQLALRIDNVALHARLTSRKMLEDYMGSIEASKSFAGAEYLQSPRLLQLFDADGLVSRMGAAVAYQGVVVAEELLLPIIQKLRQLAARGIASSNMLPEVEGSAASYASQASGALYVGLSEEAGDYLLLLRRELVETVIWAGNPHEAVSADEQDRLHPRTSFAAWHEAVRGRSRPWSELELESASFLREQLLRVQDARKLSLANEALAVAHEAQAVQSGRAEMAVSVLHDIGNAITGIGTRSAQMLAEPAWAETGNLARLNALLQSQGAVFGSALGERKAAALGGLALALERSLRDREITLREHVQSLVRSVSHVQAVLSVQRQYANQGGSGARSRVAPGELVHDAIAIHAAAIEKRGIQLVRRVAPDLPRLNIDRTRMVQVLGNLIQNACESFDRSQDRSISRRLEISAKNTEDGWVRLTLKDNGFGFDPKQGREFFERGTTTKAGGTGVGLASCRSTVESHGGRISIESEGRDKGATVTLDLPTGVAAHAQSEDQNA